MAVISHTVMACMSYDLDDPRLIVPQITGPEKILFCRDLTGPYNSTVNKKELAILEMKLKTGNERQKLIWRTSGKLIALLRQVPAVAIPCLQVPQTGREDLPIALCAGHARP